MLPLQYLSELVVFD